MRSISLLICVPLLACDTGDKKTSDGTDTGSDTGTTVAGTGDDTVDPTQADTGFCENFLPPIEPAELPAAKVGEAYSVAFTIGGTAAGYDWEVQSEPLPAGLEFDGATATLSGTPTMAGAFGVTIGASALGGSEGCATAPTSTSYTLTIDE